MKYLIGITALFILAGTGCKPQEQAAATPEFEFTVQKTANALSFKSVKGADWKELSYSCKELPCEFALDNSGLNAKTPASGFAISFKLFAHEVDMTSVNGTTWDNLIYACEDEKCPFRVTDKGVFGI